jgi:hypothetical protein
MHLKQSLLAGLVGVILASLALAACGGGSGAKDPAAQTVNNYLQALVAGDNNRITTLSCKDFEKQANLEVDSFAGVKPSLKDVVCQVRGTEGSARVVTCTGKISATYGNEVQEFDLSKQSYIVNQQGSDWLVCGHK